MKQGKELFCGGVEGGEEQGRINSMNFAIKKETLDRNPSSVGPPILSMEMLL